MASSRSVSHWIGQLRAGDQAPLGRLLRRLVGLAGKLQSLPCRADEEDVPSLRQLRAEIAAPAKLRRTPRTVERKLDLIRRRWTV